MSCLEMKEWLQGYLKTIKVLFLLKKESVSVFINPRKTEKRSRGAKLTLGYAAATVSGETGASCKFSRRDF